jgi:hypothetical protein
MLCLSHENINIVLGFHICSRPPEPLFDYLKPSPSTSSEMMQLSDDEPMAHDVLDSKSDSSGMQLVDEDQSMEEGDPIPNLNLANITASTDDDDNDEQDEDVSQQEAIADAEISINLNSPVRNSTVGYIKPRDRRASVTMNTQEALNEVYNMYGKPARNSDESDDNFDSSEPGDDDRLYDDNTAYTVAGVCDATADVTFWSQPHQNHDPNHENILHHSNPTPFQDENALACRQPLQDENALACRQPLQGQSKYSILPKSYFKILILQLTLCSTSFRLVTIIIIWPIPWTGRV